MDSTRASDAEREHVAERLREACLEGRLDTDELDERLAAALSARTRGELTVLLADLPVARAPARPERPAFVAPPARPLGTLAVRGVVALVTLLTVMALLLPGEAWFAVALVTVGVAITAMVLLTALAPFIAAGAVIALVVRKLGGDGRRPAPGPWG